MNESVATIIDPGGRRLADIIRDLVSQPAARCKLPRGLHLTWRSVDATHGRFQVLRIGVLPSSKEVEIVRRDAATAGLRLSGAPGSVDITKRNLRWMGYGWDVGLGGVQDKLPLPDGMPLEWRGR